MQTEDRCLERTNPCFLSSAGVCRPCLFCFVGPFSLAVLLTISLYLDFCAIYLVLCLCSDTQRHPNPSALGVRTTCFLFWTCFAPALPKPEFLSTSPSRTIHVLLCRKSPIFIRGEICYTSKKQFLHYSQMFIC